MIKIAGLTLTIGDKRIIDRISFTLSPGEKLAILGPNGAGKSSVLKCIAQEHTHYDGSLEISGASLKHLNAQKRAQHMAVMPQKTEVAFPFRSHQIVAMGRAPFGDERQSHDMMRKAMEMTDVWHLRDQLYPMLSGGEQQRVQLARVLVQIWPSENKTADRWLLLDECTSALDPAHQHNVMNTVSEFADNGTGVLAVMHDTALATSWADKVIILNQGRVCAEGDASILTDAAILQDSYDLSYELAKQYAQQNTGWVK